MLHKTCSVSCLLFKNLMIRPVLKMHASSLDAKMMNKVMGLRKKTKKKSWYQSTVGANRSFEDIIKQTTKNESGRNTNKRVNILNNILMKNITDLMTAGELFDKIFGYGLEITKVSISSDYRFVKVFWMSKAFEDEAKLDELLNSISGALRHELSNLQIMGEVPVLKFVKDKTFDNIKAVDNLLKKADFGEDFVPTCPTLLNKYETIYTVIEPELKVRINDLEDSENISEEQEELIPPMKMDVMGLDHATIMSRINASLQKSKAVHRQSNNTQNVMKNIGTSNSEEEPQYMSFKDFVKKRRIQQAKAYCSRRSRSIERDMYEEDLRSFYNNNNTTDENLVDDEYPFNV
ncbi:uncharacterized protein LOC126840525 [Adelges cooleyi]|uniref:uncharacterized protein LOC126840525 n=1 Tax=Adelges cooleyi TaxID=133065 RepID=UPI00217F52B6|nr:uncharacterized protein LOC126840525 [Adelges cooleyi]